MTSRLFGKPRKATKQGSKGNETESLLSQPRSEPAKLKSLNKDSSNKQPGEQDADDIPLLDLESSSSSDEDNPQRNPNRLESSTTGTQRDDFARIDRANVLRNDGPQRNLSRLQSSTASNQRDESVGRNQDRILQLAREIAEGSRNVNDETLELSDGQKVIVEALVRQLQSIEALQRQLAKVEALREEAMRLAEEAFESEMPPPIELYRLVGLEPDFQAPDLLTRSAILDQYAPPYRVIITSHPKTVADRIQKGLKPASQLEDRVPLSGDESKANVVSVNVIPATKDLQTASRLAHYAACNRANGALPITIEQYGDQIPNNMAQETLASHLEMRAMQSALFIIDPAELSREERDQIDQMQNGGERGLGDVPPSAIVAVLVPAPMAATLQAQTDRAIIPVANRVSSVYYAGTKSEQPINHPDYESGLTAVFAANFEKTLVTHVTRLGQPAPITK